MKFFLAIQYIIMQDFFSGYDCKISKSQRKCCTEHFILRMIFSLNSTTWWVFAIFALYFMAPCLWDTPKEPAMRSLDGGLIINRIKHLQKPSNGRWKRWVYVIMTLGIWFENTLSDWYMTTPHATSISHGHIHMYLLISIKKNAWYSRFWCVDKKFDYQLAIISMVFKWLYTHQRCLTIRNVFFFKSVTRNRQKFDYA